MPLDGNAIPGSISERTKIGPIVVEWKRFQSCFQSNRNEMLPAVGKDKFYGMIVHISDREERFIDAEQSEHATSRNSFYLSSYVFQRRKYQ